jgi:hypothetical protein
VETGLGLDWSKIQVSLFNVSDPTAPTRSAVLNASPLLDPNEQGWSWSWSEATYEHKAFQYWNGQLAIPLSTYRYNQQDWNYEFVSKLVIIDVGEDTLTINGTIDHSDFYNRGDSDYYWGEYNVRRSIFMGDYIYAISAGGVTATNLTTMEQSSAVELTPDYYYNYYYTDNQESETSDKESDETTDDGKGSGSSGGSSDDPSTSPTGA